MKWGEECREKSPRTRITVLPGSELNSGLVRSRRDLFDELFEVAVASTDTHELRELLIGRRVVAGEEGAKVLCGVG